MKLKHFQNLESTDKSDTVFPCQYWIGKEEWYNLKPLEKFDGEFYQVDGTN